MSAYAIKAIAPSRRAFLLTTASFGLYCVATGIPEAAPAAPGSFLGPVIDVHGHIFNGKDIPAREFFAETIVREQGLPRLLRFLKFVVSWWVRKAPDASDELRDLIALDNQKASIAQTRLPPPDANPETKQAYEEGIKELAQDAQFGLSSNERTSIPYFSTEVSGTRKTVYANESADTLLFLYQEMGLTDPVLQQLRTVDTLKLRSTLSSDLGVSSLKLLHKAESEVNRLADALVRATKERKPRTGGVLAFARNLRSYRAGLADELAGLTALPQSMKPRMVSPLIVDFDHWYGVETSTPLALQAEVAGKISRFKSLQPSVLINGFIAFDPFRALIERKTGPKAGQALQAVIDAIDKHGFVGVKIYPPMGFRAIGNSQRSNDLSNAPLVRQMLKKYGMSESDFYSGLDAELTSLYDHCLDKDIPIVAHCAVSQTSYDGSGLHADPAYWRQLLRSRSVKWNRPYATLRVNLGHFGSIWCHDPVYVAEGDNKDRQKRCTASMPWTAAIIDMVCETDAAGKAAYPNLFFDFSDLDSVLHLNETGKESREPFLQFLRGQILTSARRDRFFASALYGTDWFMLSLSENYPAYLMGAIDMVVRLAPDQKFSEQVFWRNALRYLGLSPKSMLEKKLQDFYVGDAAKLATLDTLIKS